MEKAGIASSTAFGVLFGYRQLAFSAEVVLWRRLAADQAGGWAQTKVLAVDGLRYMRNPPAGELLRGRMTVMGKDPVGDEKGIVIAQHDLLDEGGLFGGS